MVTRFDFSKFSGFDWDKGNLGHIKNHNVDYRECEQMFFNKPLFIQGDEKHSRLERRFHALGQTNEMRLLFIAFTIRRNYIRVISARDQNKKERKKTQKTGGESL